MPAYKNHNKICVEKLHNKYRPVIKEALKENKVLFKDEQGKDHTELDYVIYYLKNNALTQTHVDAIKAGNPKVMGSIPHDIWLQGLKQVQPRIK